MTNWAMPDMVQWLQRAKAFSVKKADWMPCYQLLLLELAIWNSAALLDRYFACVSCTRCLPHACCTSIYDYVLSSGCSLDRHLDWTMSLLLSSADSTANTKFAKHNDLLMSMYQPHIYFIQYIVILHFEGVEQQSPNTCLQLAQREGQLPT